MSFVHPLELPLGELVNELAETYTSGVDDKCYVASPTKCDQMVATLVKNRVTEFAERSHDTTMAVTEEAARFAIQAIRKWSEESETPLTCSSIWNAERGAAAPCGGLQCLRIRGLVLSSLQSTVSRRGGAADGSSISAAVVAFLA